MSQPDHEQEEASDELPPERRKHWRDRRMQADRRNPERQLRTDFDCRSGFHRRKSDLGGELSEGEIWWHEEDKAS